MEQATFIASIAQKYQWPFCFLFFVFLLATETRQDIRLTTTKYLLKRVTNKKQRSCC